MFDIGFWEILIVSFIILIVVGPDKLPDFMRQAGKYLGIIRRLINNLKREFKNQILEEKKPFEEELDDLDGLMKNAPDQANVEKTKPLKDQP